MTFLIESKTFLTLETKIKVKDFLDLKKKKKKNSFSKLYKQSDKKVEKVRFFKRGWSMVQLVKKKIFHVFI